MRSVVAMLLLASALPAAAQQMQKTDPSVARGRYLRFEQGQRWRRTVDVQKRSAQMVRCMADKIVDSGNGNDGDSGKGFAQGPKQRDPSQVAAINQNDNRASVRLDADHDGTPRALLPLLTPPV